MNKSIDKNILMRNLPSIDKLLQSSIAVDSININGHNQTAILIRNTLSALRDDVLNDRIKTVEELELEKILLRFEQQLKQYENKKLQKTIYFYCAKNNINLEKIRFDVITIKKETKSYKLIHYKNNLLFPCNLYNIQKSFLVLYN